MVANLNLFQRFQDNRFSFVGRESIKFTTNMSCFSSFYPLLLYMVCYQNTHSYMLRIVDCSLNPQKPLLCMMPPMEEPYVRNGGSFLIEVAKKIIPFLTQPASTFRETEPRTQEGYEVRKTLDEPSSMNFATHFWRKWMKAPVRSKYQNSTQDTLRGEIFETIHRLIDVAWYRFDLVNKNYTKCFPQGWG